MRADGGGLGCCRAREGESSCDRADIFDTSVLAERSGAFIAITLPTSRRSGGGDNIIVIIIVIITIIIIIVIVIIVIVVIIVIIVIIIIIILNWTIYLIFSEQSRR